MEKVLQEIRGEQIRQSERIRTLFAQQQDLKKLTASVYRLSAGVEKLTVSVGATETKLGKLTADVETLREKPGKRWENAVTVLVTAVLTAAATFFLTRMGVV